MATGEEEPFFLHWTNARRREGRRVMLDGLDELIVLVADAVPTTQVAHAFVVIHSTGVPMTRLPRRDRLAMSEWCVLARWYAIVQRCGGGSFTERDLLSNNKHCVLCVACVSASAGELQTKLTDTSMLVCQQCLSPWHKECAARQLPIGSDARFTAGFVCYLCAASL